MSKQFIIFMFLFFLTFSLFAINAETIYNKDHYYITSGLVYLDIPAKELSDIITDYAGYRNWALKGIDGKDPRSKKFNIILADIIFQEISQNFMLLFDLNLVWPFGSKGNKVYFDIIKDFTSTGIIKTIEYRLSKPTPLVPWASLSIEVFEHLSECKIYFKCKIKLAWFVDIFFTLKGYKKNIEMRIIQIIRNLKRFQNKDKYKKKEFSEDELKFIKEKIKSFPFYLIEPDKDFLYNP